MKKIIALIMSLSILLTGFSVINAETETAEKELKIGDYIQIGEYYDEPIIWRCMLFGNPEKKEDSNVPEVSEYRKENNINCLPLLLSDEILCLKAFDAEATQEGSNNSHSRRKNGRASNYWADSTIRSWLNSEADAGEVEWLCSNPPTADSVSGRYNAYDKESGFLTNFTDSELGLIQEVSQKSFVGFPEYNNGVYSEKEEMVDSGYDALGNTTGISKGYSYWEYTPDKVFLLSSEQLHYIKQLYDIEVGYEKGVLSEGCAANSENITPLIAGRNWEYWLKDPVSSTANNVETFNTDKSTNGMTSNNADNSCIGVRPAFFMKSDIEIISGEGTKDSPYILAVKKEPETNAVSTPKPIQTPVKEDITFKTSDWAKSAVEDAYENDIIPDELLNTDLTLAISREEFAAVAVNLYETESDISSEISIENPFNDISDSIYHNYILKAYEYNITSGTGENTFSPKNLITREEMATMLSVVYRKLSGEHLLTDYENTTLFADDNQISEYARDHVYFMANKNIISGIGDNKFAPNGKEGGATREQAISIAVRCINNLK